jgi:hypothetical protein
LAAVQLFRLDVEREIVDIGAPKMGHQTVPESKSKSASSAYKSIAYSKIGGPSHPFRHKPLIVFHKISIRENARFTTLRRARVSTCFNSFSVAD